MNFYEFKCDKCGHVQSFQHNFRDIASAAHNCPACSLPMRRIFSAPKIKIGFRAGHDPYTGQNFNSQAARDAYIADSGLQKVGDK